MCNFAEKNMQLCPMPYVCICVYYMQYISFAIYVLVPIALPATFSLCHIPDSLIYIPYMEYSLFHSSHPLYSSYLIPYTCPIHDSCIPYSMHVPYSILPILLFLIPYYLFHMNSYDPFVASLSGPKQRCAVWVAHRLDQTWGGRGHA